ncbi:MAG: carboxylating nicotinate-nucleotide diphosphorylase [Candidatus Micrarchaeota archaeon]|nr:carboxylating nicotinate-nucleotide diphosphorylase [Candidatus Micrarchaeota archaeon]
MGWEKKFLRQPDRARCQKAALQALWEDSSYDITSQRTIPAHLRCKAKIVAKSSFVLCGVVEADAIFKSRLVQARWLFREGQQVKKGKAVCLLEGNCRSILACERTALNYLSLLSGIATKCAEASRKYGRWRVAATRKALPLLSNSQKRAVKVGGCLTHRLSLADGILVKDNHLAAIMKEKKVKKEEAVKIALQGFEGRHFVEVEVSSVREAVAAAGAGAGAILVDNLPPSSVRKIANAVKKARRGIIVEASGGITLKNAGSYLKAGADLVSTSELTMSICPADLSLEIEPF